MGDHDTLTHATHPWAPVRVVDSDRAPWQFDPYWKPGDPKGLTKNKILFQDKETKSRLMILRCSPGWPGGALQYHTFHEWAYCLAGDLTNNESTHPSQRSGPLMRYREGYFLDRPPYSLHGGEKGRQDFMKSQASGTILIMEEGDPMTETIYLDRDHPRYSDSYKKVTHWAVPRIIDTIGLLPWEPDPVIPGLHVKHLVYDHSRGFAVRLLWLAPGSDKARLGEFGRAHYREHGWQFLFVLFGDLALQGLGAPGENPQRFVARERFLVERPPNSIIGIGDGVATEEGCVWLEATYGSGARVSIHPIEEPILV